MGDGAKEGAPSFGRAVGVAVLTTSFGVADGVAVISGRGVKVGVGVSVGLGVTNIVGEGDGASVTLFAS